eukprot:1101695-Amorphochlora_amoeboformis.AAC.2
MGGIWRVASKVQGDRVEMLQETYVKLLAELIGEGGAHNFAAPRRRRRKVSLAVLTTGRAYG